MANFTTDLVLNAIQRQTGKSLPDIISAFKRFLPRIEAARPAAKAQPAAPQPQVLRAAPEPVAPVPVPPARPVAPVGVNPVGPVRVSEPVVPSVQA